MTEKPRTKQEFNIVVQLMTFITDHKKKFEKKVIKIFRDFKYYLV